VNWGWGKVIKWRFKKSEKERLGFFIPFPKEFLDKRLNFISYFLFSFH
jgi:hypothetical protein